MSKSSDLSDAFLSSRTVKQCRERLGRMVDEVEANGDAVRGWEQGLYCVDGNKALREKLGDVACYGLHVLVFRLAVAVMDLRAAELRALTRRARRPERGPGPAGRSGRK